MQSVMKRFALIAVVAALVVAALPSLAFGATVVGTKKNSTGSRSCRSTTYYTSSQDTSKWVITSTVCSEVASTGTQARYMQYYIVKWNWNMTDVYYSTRYPSSGTISTSAMSHTFGQDMTVTKDYGAIYTQVQVNYYANGVRLTTYANLP